MDAQEWNECLARIESMIVDLIDLLKNRPWLPSPAPSPTVVVASPPPRAAIKRPPPNVSAIAPPTPPKHTATTRPHLLSLEIIPTPGPKWAPITTTLAPTHTPLPRPPHSTPILVPTIAQLFIAPLPIQRDNNICKSLHLHLIQICHQSPCTTSMHVKRIINSLITLSIYSGLDSEVQAKEIVTGKHEWRPPWLITGHLPIASLWTRMYY
ncbi:hypothetical protein QVD17_30217 [Tagetes erecta]|uniref:Uncharacterized protein n=1 Tax=Tagetes erecta TaxID=13708 RepID=A0AAD8K344_TARER|nr:hypothetical protein QVD17_30217 [Tagetes erecta]